MKGTTKLLTITAIIALLTACGSSTTSIPVSAPESVDSVVSVVEESIVEESVVEESILEEPTVEDSTATVEQPEETPAPTVQPEKEPADPEEPETLTAATATPAPTAKATSTPKATPKPATTTTAPAAKTTPTPAPTQKPVTTTATPTATPKPATTTAPTPTPTPAHVHSWVTVAATGHYETVQTGTVHHDAVTHEEIEWRSVYQCNECLAIFYSSYDIDTHIIFGECGAGNSQWTEQVGSHTVVDQAAYDEPVYEKQWVEDTPAYEKCSGCGQTR